MPVTRRHNDITIVRVNYGPNYLYFLKKDGEILAGGQSFDEKELAEYLKRENPAGNRVNRKTQTGFTDEK